MNRMWLLALLTVSSMAHAEWTLVLKSPDIGENYYLDLDTLKEVDGVMQITTLQDFPGGKKEVCQGDTCAFLSSSRVSVRHVECSAGRQRQIQFTDYDSAMGQGQVLQTASGGPKKRYFRWYYPAPGSFFEVLIQKVCKPS